LAPDVVEPVVDEASPDALIVEAFGAAARAFEKVEDALRAATGVPQAEQEEPDTSVTIEEPVAVEESLPEEVPASLPDPVQDLADGLAAQPPEEVVTRTMAKVYARQGLYDLALKVFDQLIEAEPGDETLISLREELVQAAGREPAGEVIPEASPEADVQAEEGYAGDIVSIELLAPDQPDTLT
ncbi:MAG: hypothetical protein KAJ42_08320, partial [Gemmatimonadetes bacterium]|nr:hypothetical protein [Gemmatimonadota bacterium]